MSRHVSPDADPVTRCGSCGYGRNPYRHARCPVCYVADSAGYWLGCESCGYDWLAESGPNDKSCPRCEAPSRAIAEVRTPEV